MHPFTEQFKENWAVVMGCDGRYKISDLGRFKVMRNTNRGGRVQRAGVYEGDKYLTLLGDDESRRRVFLSVLALETFIGPRPEGASACHKNDNRSDNRLVNLYWGDASTNKLDAVRNGLANIPKGSRHRDAKLTEETVLEARRLRRIGWSVANLCKKYGVTRGPMSLAVRGLTWKHIQER